MSQPATKPASSYRTSDIELASFLLAKAHQLLIILPDGVPEFFFLPEVAGEVEMFEAEEPISPKALFKSYRELQSLCAQSGGR